MWTFNLLNTGSKTLKSSMLKGSQLFKNIRPVQVKFFSVPTNIDTATYLYLTNETLESLNDKFGELIEDHDKFSGGDTILSDGVLTVKLAENGTYVVNKQTPNKQIWLSSPVSGPSRYDVETSGDDEGCWVYKHTGETLHSLLEKEIGAMLGKEAGFEECFMGGSEYDCIPNSKGDFGGLINDYEK